MNHALHVAVDVDEQKVYRQLLYVQLLVKDLNQQKPELQEYCNNAHDLLGKLILDLNRLTYKL